MVATIIAAVGDDGPKRKVRIALWHVAGLVTGAVALGLVATALGRALPPPEPLFLSALGMAGLFFAGAVLVGHPLPLPTRLAQVPSSWFYVLEPGAFAFAYGIGLGLGFLTRIMSFSFYAFMGLVFVLADPQLAIVAVAGYAFGRGLPVLLAVGSGRSAEDLVAIVGRVRAVGIHSDAVVLAVISAILISASV